MAGELVIPKRTNSAFIATDSRRCYGLAVTRPWWWWASSQTIPLRRLSEWPAILDLQSTLFLMAASPLVAPIGTALHGMQKM